MTNSEKGVLYDDYLAKIYQLQNEVNRIKSNNALNMSDEAQSAINENNMKISILQTKVENLFK
jgi:hypothetical protein